MDRRIADLYGLRYFKEAGRRADRALVADLAALLGVEAGAVEDQADFRFGQPAAGVERVVRDPAEDGAFGGRAGPLGAVVGRRQAAADIQRDLLAAALLAAIVLVFAPCARS